MKKKIKIAGLLTCGLLFLGGCGENPTLKNGEDALITFDGAKGISVNDLYETLKDQYGIGSLLTLMDKRIYETEYKDKMEEAQEYADNYVDSMIKNYGDETKLIQSLNGSFSTIEAYNQYLYVSYLQNIAIEDYSKSLINDDQIKKYYDEEFYGDVELNHILITSDASSTASEEEVKKAEDAAKEKINKLIKELKTAKDDKKDIEEVFSKLAKENSSDSATKDKDGSMGKINYIDYDTSYDELVNTAKELKVGEFSTKVIETELGYHIIYKAASHDKDDLKDVEKTILQKLSDNALATDYYMIINGLKHYREKYGFEINDKDLDKDYDDYMKNLVAQIESYYKK